MTVNRLRFKISEAMRRVEETRTTYLHFAREYDEGRVARGVYLNALEDHIQAHGRCHRLAARLLQMHVSEGL